MSERDTDKTTFAGPYGAHRIRIEINLDNKTHTRSTIILILNNKITMWRVASSSKCSSLRAHMELTVFSETTFF